MTGVIGAIWGLTGRQWLQTLLLPPRLVLPFQRNNCGARLFEILRQKKKNVPGVPGKWACFPGNLETFVSQMANQEPPDSKGIVFRHWGAAPPGKWSSSWRSPPPLRRGTAKTRVLFAHVFRGGVTGSQSAVRRDPDV